MASIGFRSRSMIRDNPELHIADNIESLFTATSEFILKTSEEAIRERGRFIVALSGGNSPKGLYTMLASGKFRERITWNRIFFFFSDERFVPADDPQSNFRMTKETLFDPLGIPEHRIFPVNTQINPSASARVYEEAIRKQFGNGCKFDLILLGLGDDAHTASLFPHAEILNEKRSLVKAFFAKEMNQYRITFTASLINRAAVIAFMTYGQSKANAVYHSLRGPLDPQEYPAQLIRSKPAKVHWFLDTEAAKHVV
jgi:6-phosphogluconolactonase